MVFFFSFLVRIKWFLINRFISFFSQILTRLGEFSLTNMVLISWFSFSIFHGVRRYFINIDLVVSFLNLSYRVRKIFTSLRGLIFPFYHYLKKRVFQLLVCCQFVTHSTRIYTLLVHLSSLHVQQNSHSRKKAIVML